MSLIRRFGILIMIILAGLSLAACSTGFIPGDKGGSPAEAAPDPSYRPSNGLVQSSAEEPVTVDVEWMGLQDGQLAFAVAMNTHSVDLDSYDLAALAVLRDSGGQEYLPSRWDSNPGGHHRRGTLFFPPPDLVTQETGGYLELTIKDIGGIGERVLLWELPQR